MGTVVFYSVILIFIGFFSQAVVLNSQNITCNPNDLKALKDSFYGPSSGIEGWNFNSSSPNCCNWVGITCSPDEFDFGRVVKLELGRKRLVGRIPESLGNLEQLKTLNLSHNFLKGSIPVSLLHLQMLEILDLAFNEIDGLFPQSINLPSIKVVNISENSIQGPVPVGICINSTRISSLHLGDNLLRENLPAGIGNCTSLEELCLASNFLSGALPDDLFRLPKLANLALQLNRFSGQLSELVGNLSNLVRVDLSLNEFSGNLPDVFHRFRNLSYFSAESNGFSGKLPDSLANSNTITSLSLRNNSFSDVIDLNCSAMTSLVSLDLATNKFHGKIPHTLPSCQRLKMINFAKINFTGEIPESFKNFQSLSFLSLSNSSISNLTGALEILQHCKNLTTLVLTLNFRDEAMPSFPSLQFSGLKALVIANCRLTGVIPQWLSGCTNLRLLDLSWNRLQGKVPPWFGDFQFLFYLDLSNNSFSGDIPKELTVLQSLVSGNVSLKDPSLDFPLFLRRNISHKGLPYKQILSFPPTLELGNNFFSGPIWPDFGNLKGLHVLDLKCNNLTGSIPRELSHMTSLETLDLSHNSLSGTIPLSLVNLSFLSKFSVAYNKLHGAIPNGAQFITFSSSSFEGNSNLCGEHGSYDCANDRQVPNVSSTRRGRPRGTIIAMAVGVGVGTVFILALMSLIITRACSHKVTDLEKRDDDTLHKDLDEQDSMSLVILFQNSETSEMISLGDLVKATNDFDQSHIIGCGGYGLVYKAVLPNGRRVAIKRLSGEYGEMEREFQAEIETLSRAQHPNLVPLQGYCNYKNDRLLIYSYMENGSLDYWLHEKVDGPSLLDWDKRLKIARGSARALAYLHESCEPHILHRDIKSGNILLDTNFEGRLADFGLARLIYPYDTHVSTDLVGTLGYIPPEYGQASVATYKGDVYSFGVVLLELLTGKRPMDMCKPQGCRDLISWVIQMKSEKRETEVMDPFIYAKGNAEEMLLVLDIACLCLSEIPKIRPSTEQLVSWLDKLDSASSSFSSEGEKLLSFC